MRIQFCRILNLGQLGEEVEAQITGYWRDGYRATACEPGMSGTFEVESIVIGKSTNLIAAGIKVSENLSQWLHTEAAEYVQDLGSFADRRRAA